MGVIILGLLLVAAIICTLAYAVVTIAKGKDLPAHYFTIPLAVVAGVFAMSLLRSL